MPADVAVLVSEAAYFRRGSSHHGDANNDRRRIRHARHPACGLSATYRAECFEAQITELFDRVRPSDDDVAQVL